MSSKELLKLNLTRSWHGYEAFLLLIAVLEGMMMVYGLLCFDFGELRRRLYFACYVLLFCCTVLAFIINRSCLKSGKHDTLLLYNVYIYIAVLIFWSAAISALDLNGGGYPVTYMTIMAGVGSMVALHPVIYGCMAILSSGGMIALALYIGGANLGVPFYLNHIIFLVVILAIEVRNCHSLRNQYLMDKRLEELTEIDSLTQIANRRRLDRYMMQLLEEGTTFTFALLDVDNFKFINDTYGHLEGDISLVRISQILTDIFGETVFRYGGDEFAVISFEDSQSVAEKFLLVNLRLKEEVVGYVLQICSGVYQKREQDDERRVFEFADSALYEAKQNGKACTVIYSDAPQQRSGLVSS
ncbi:MAG: GGDEF domain-containing protein [Candidatus Limivicinus sp.]